uniref:Cytoskeleton-associated protein 5-like n=1 Tax=Pogona vitticeps TaxID=103695 RepID=A0ABM5FVF0_9SAUR
MLEPQDAPEEELSEESCERAAAAVLPASCLQHLDSPDPQPCRRNDAVDISKKISAELISKMQDANWKVQREGLEEVLRMLREVHAIQPTLGDLPVTLNSCLHDSNRAIAKLTLAVLQQLARVMGPALRPHVKTLGLSIITILRDSTGSLRAAALATVEAWAEQTGVKEWLDGEELLANLKKENGSQRQGLLGWLAEQLPSSSSSVSTDLLRCVPHLYSALEDRHEETRLAACKALPFFLLHLGSEKMSESASKLKPASREQVLALLEKAKAVQPTKANSDFSKPLSVISRGTSWFKSTLAPIQESPTVSFLAEKVESGELGLDLKKASPEGAVPKPKRPPNVKIQVKFGMKEDTSKLGPIFIVVPKGKEQRAKDEKFLKVLKWNFPTPSSKYVEQLKAQMSGCLSNWLQEEMFHSNFQHHIRALTVMTKHLEAEKEGVISCLDLVLKWLSLRLFDTNTWVLMKTLEYLRKLFALLVEERYQLTEIEASSFLPYLLLKMGVTKESILKEVRAIVRQVTVVYPPSRTFVFLLEGTQAKNANQRVGCLKELGWLLKAYGPEVCQPNPSKVLKTILTLTGDSNNAVHMAALRVIGIARNVYGVEAFKMIGNISDKHMSLLEEDIKEVEGKQGREEKLGSQFLNLSARVGSAEGSKQSHGTDSDSEEEDGVFHPDEPEMENADVMPFCNHPTVDNIFLQHPPRESPTKGGNPLNIDMVICQVASGNIGTSVEALFQIQEVLNQEDKVEAMSGHINQFLIASVQQLKFIHWLYVTAEEEMRREQVIQLYRCVVGDMISLFQVEELAREASAGVLKDLLSSLITLLLDSPVEELQEAQKIAQSVSFLITKVLEKSDHNRILKTLLLILREVMTASVSLVAFSEMVAKCLWKVAGHLPETIEGVNVDQVLLDIHVFMKALPQEKLKKYQSSYPFRAMTTLVHVLCKLKGTEILDHLTLIKDRSESELEAYLWKIVGYPGEQADVEAEEAPPSPAEDKADDTLAEIFEKIRSKKAARAGLVELYEYKEKCPQADFEPFLKDCSLFIRSYIKRGLAVIASKRERNNSFAEKPD